MNDEDDIGEQFLRAEKDGANWYLSSRSSKELAKFFQGNCSPIYDCATYCDDEHLPKLIESILLCVLQADRPDDEVEEIVPLLTGLEYRYAGGLGVRDPKFEAFADLLARSITKALCQVREKVDIRPKDI
jgi:hypothetical protein